MEETMKVRDELGNVYYVKKPTWYDMNRARRLVVLEGIGSSARKVTDFTKVTTGTIVRVADYAKHEFIDGIEAVKHGYQNPR